MKILVLTKRQYTGKDLLNDRFGRLRELPLELAKLGHDITGICLSYRQRQEGLTTDRDPDSDARVNWHSLNLGKLVIPGLARYFLKSGKLARDFRPDIIWACSDSFHAIFGVWLAELSGAKCVIDLYDNFESFPATWLPGVLSLFKRAARTADGVTCVSQQLADRVIRKYRRRGLTLVLENGVRANLFYPQDRTLSRRRLGLPEDMKIIGLAGALYRRRGIHTLFRGFELLSSQEKNLHLAIAGPRNHRSQIPRGPRVHDLGVLPLEKVPHLINALDLAVVCNRDSLFGQFNFPQKFYEIVACRTPLIAASVGAVKELLARYPECLFEPDNPQSLANAARSQLSKPTIPELKATGWSEIAKRLEAFLENILARDANVVAK